jgi:PAS domain S-box-containing protein
VTLPGGNRREILAVSVAVLAFAGLLTFALWRLTELEQDTYTDSGEGIIWALSQTQYEIQRLLLVTTAESGATPDEIGLRFDIVLSRLQLLQEGRMAQRIADAGRGNVAARATEQLLELEALVATSGPRVERYRARLYRTMVQYLEPLGSIANELMIQNRITDGERRANYNASIVQVIVSILGIMATGAFLIFRLMRSLRASSEAEARVRREKAFLDLLLQSSGEGIAVFDNRLVCTHWNDEMAALLGRSAGDSLGQPIAALDSAVSSGDFATVLGGKPVYLAPQLGSDGVYLERSLNPIRLNEAITGGIVVVRDVTERYDAQRERQLREVYRDFVTMVSHQFRTPLAVIDSTVHRIVRRGSRMDEAELAERAKTIRMSVAGLSRLMDATLTAERIDAGIFKLTVRPVDLGQLLVEVCDRFRELFPERTIELSLNLSGPVDCDALLVDQALANLVGNALKYSSAPHAVEIDAHESGGRAVVAVRDHGVGIPAEEHGRVFDRFFRASTSATVPGSGVGLYTARQIALLHNGDITLASSCDAGSTFTLSLPLRSQEET